MTAISQSTESVTTTTAATSRGMSKRTRDGLTALALTTLALVMLFFWLAPLGYMFLTSVKSLEQIQNGQLLPSTPRRIEYDGKERDMFSVPLPDGSTRELIMIEPGRESSVFVDPADPSQTPIEWQGRWRTLEQAWTFSPLVENFGTAWNQLDFPKLLRNTFGIAILSTIGAVLSSILVAYGFARFRFPGKNVLFVIVRFSLDDPLTP